MRLGVSAGMDTRYVTDALRQVKRKAKDVKIAASIGRPVPATRATHQFWRYDWGDSTEKRYV